MFNIAQLPAKYRQMSVAALEKRALEVKAQLGKDLFIPAHHYQKDEVLKFADKTGDSLELANYSRDNAAKYIVFCGVHFMAETADMLTADDQIVLLPDLRAGCSMADMANIQQVERCDRLLQEQYQIDVLPLTYVNSTAAIKAFVGRKNGACLTSGNAHKMVSWALSMNQVILFLPDQHLGRNTAYDLGVPLDQMAIYDPIRQTLIYEGDVSDIRIILWQGHCSVHEKFTTANIEHLRRTEPDRRIIVHPECSFDVVRQSDDNGSTRKIIQTIENAAPGTKWAIGTEMNLVNRLIKHHPELDIISLNPYMCACLTMNRIDLPHFVWCLDKIVAQDLSNQITVDAETTTYALQALDKMLQRQ
ncbi:quinolinate synthase NadA [Macrococcus bovicus]|uniref:quinolinate synthase NadA n=1 Tax=Macrococcus bovicus TaxID=69968 RepID=UPI0025A61561|nr:quinolinate synthase NadA [Macrococcus bovicus]WJP97404.1 quinolinate synthase NadA [Macrococcus bovicus]